jgi:hypothetical protein
VVFPSCISPTVPKTSTFAKEDQIYDGEERFFVERPSQTANDQASGSELIYDKSVGCPDGLPKLLRFEVR